MSGTEQVIPALLTYPWVRSRTASRWSALEAGRSRFVGGAGRIGERREQVSACCAHQSRRAHGDCGSRLRCPTALWLPEGSSVDHPSERSFRQQGEALRPHRRRGARGGHGRRGQGRRPGTTHRCSVRGDRACAVPAQDDLLPGSADHPRRPRVVQSALRRVRRRCLHQGRRRVTSTSSRSSRRPMPRWR